MMDGDLVEQRFPHIGCKNENQFELTGERLTRDKLLELLELVIWYLK